MDQVNLNGANTNQCVVTQVATFIQLINVQLPFFGVILFFANLLFLVVFVLAIPCVFCCRKRAEYQQLEEDAVDDLFYGED